MEKQTYAAAGVDLDVAKRAKELIKAQARRTHRPEVLGGVGLFGGLFQLKGYKEPVLVSSVDGVGTKLKLATALGKFDTVGVDIVNHCVNDILTLGAEPLFFLDYIAMGKLVPEQVAAIVKGIADACSYVGCALIGGETAEMPGFYPEGDFDLVGFIVGAVERGNIIDGGRIEVGDVIIGLPSSGLHTNGYSLVRRIFGTEPKALNAFYPELGRTLGEELLEPHRCYYRELKPLLPRLKGIAHITGGGLVDNLSRILPPGMALKIEKGSWGIPSIFNLIQKRGDVAEGEMFRVFNMGIGMALISSPADVSGLLISLEGAKVIGEITAAKPQPQPHIPPE
jgi:phosphoribosylformylglycinamidine cyclo-ligase